MRKITLLRAALCLIVIGFIYSFGGGTPEASAQLCAPCPDYWVEYDYIWPPCDTANYVTVDVGWQNGAVTTVSSNVDGHIFYPAPQPLSPAVWVQVNGINIPINGGKVKIPYNCGNGMINMCLEIEVRCNPCLEIKVKLVPC